MLTPQAVPRRETSKLLLPAIALVVVVAAVAVYFLATWLSARGDADGANDALASANAELSNAKNNDDLVYAKTRDEATVAGEQAIRTMNTLDYHKADEGIDRWLAVSTGTLHDDIVARRANSKKAIDDAKTVTEAEVLSSALTELDVRAGKATMIAAVKVTVMPDGKQPEAKYLRAQGTLQRTDTGWKLSGFGNVDIAR